MGGCLRVLYRIGNYLAIDDAILAEVHQAFSLGPVLREGSARVVTSTFAAVKKQASPEGMIGRQGDTFAGWRFVKRRGAAAGP